MSSRVLFQFPADHVILGLARSDVALLSLKVYDVVSRGCLYASVQSSILSNSRQVSSRMFSRMSERICQVYAISMKKPSMQDSVGIAYKIRA